MVYLCNTMLCSVHTVYVCISEQQLFRYEPLIGFYKGDGVFTARYELNL